jgi:cold shock CspA family protein
MPAATVKEFDPMKGFGTLVLEDGEELIFDIAIANKREPRAGDRAEVTIGVGWKGRPKAKLVVFEATEDIFPPFDGGIEQLRAFGFFRTWNMAQARAAATEVLGGVPVRLARGQAGALMKGYYGIGASELGRAEGVLLVDKRMASAAVADLRALCGAPDIGDAGEALPPILAAINAQLTGGERLFGLDVDGDFVVVAHRAADFESRIATAPWLAMG